MKKSFFLMAIATAMLMSSCNMSMLGPKSIVKTTATHTRISAATPVVAVFADLDVSPEKISFFYIPSTTVAKGGYDNVVNAAVREALINNGNADVLVGTTIDIVTKNKRLEITVSGYPAHYVKFRNANDKDVELQKELRKVRTEDGAKVVQNNSRASKLDIQVNR